MHPMELKKTIILKITGMIPVLRKNALFFWELNNSRAITQVRDTLITIFLRHPVLNLQNNKSADFVSLFFGFV